MSRSKTPKKAVKKAVKVDYEAMFEQQLIAAKVKYEREYRFMTDRRWRHDFYLPDYRLAVEIEGVVYNGRPGAHQTGSGYQNDCQKYNESAIAGIRLLRFTPAQVTGRAKQTTKGAPYMEQAIDTLKRWMAVNPPAS